MSKPKRISKRDQRRLGREEAARRVGEVARYAIKLRRNDVIGSHYTVWLSLRDRVEWWPGSRHWRLGQSGGVDHRGTFDEFINWLRRATGL